MVKDYLGNKLDIGMDVIRCSSGYSKSFTKAKIVDINPSRPDGAIIKVLGENNSNPGWTYPTRLLGEHSVNF